VKVHKLEWQDDRRFYEPFYSTACLAGGKGIHDIRDYFTHSWDKTTCAKCLKKRKRPGKKAVKGK
jgi:hypothetical protein